MSVRPIDANALRKQIKNLQRDFKKSPAKQYVVKIILSMLNDRIQTPTLDYEPVVHAHWKTEGKSDYLIQRQCSNCNGMLTQSTEQEKSPFCCYCGAKMDEEVKG